MTADRRFDAVLAAAYGILVRDLSRALRQRGRLVGGLARSFMWLLLVGTGYSSIARIQGAQSYHAFIFPGIVVMATFFAAMLTAISTVYDREFGVLRLMLASPAGMTGMLVGRIAAATLIGFLQGSVVLLFLPFFAPVTASALLWGLGAVLVTATSSSALGLLVAAPLRSVENFAAVVNVLLFPLLFLSGALYPIAGMPPALAMLARLNPVTYAVELLRTALDQPPELSAAVSLSALAATTIVAAVLTAVVFDPERRFAFRERAGRA